MAKSSGADLHQNPYNEVVNKDPNKPDAMGDALYYGGYDEILARHLSETGPMVSTPNSDATHDLYGGPAQGEANPGGWAGKGGGKGSK